MCWLAVNSLRPRLKTRAFTDDIFKYIFLNENELILPRISLKFVPNVRINNIPALVQIMAWRRPGDKPLSEPMMVSLLTHICVTRPQWVDKIIDIAGQDLVHIIDVSNSVYDTNWAYLTLYRPRQCKIHDKLQLYTDNTIMIKSIPFPKLTGHYNNIMEFNPEVFQSYMCLMFLIFVPFWYNDYH